jgi:tetratricopeptide (TPR) repeat protein
MQRPAQRIALFACALIFSGAASSEDILDSAQSASVFGAVNPLLTRGSEALQAGHYEEGVRLTLEGLEQPSSARDKAAAHSNVCAGYVAMKRWIEALEHCNLALELDRHNWRTFNNRAAVFVGLRKFDLAMTDVNSGLELAPDSATLLKSKEVVIQHRNAASRWHRPDKV